MLQNPNQLEDDTGGSYTVRTASGSAYIIHLDEPRYIVRLPEESLPEAEYVDDRVARLRLDNSKIDLVKIDSLVVGEPGRLWLNIRHDGVLTYRTTTPVITITAGVRDG